MKKCTKCLLDLELDQFGNRTASLDGKDCWCKKCKYEYKKSWWKTNKARELQNIRMKQKGRESKAWVLKQLGIIQCQTEGCTESHQACLDFHHIDRKTKSFRLAGGTKSKEKMLEEAKKCLVICANCHRKLHYENG